MGYACFPEMDTNGEAKLNTGQEFVIAARYSMNALCTTDKYFAENIQAVVGAIMDGSLS